MNLKDRLELRIFINLLISFFQRLVSLINKFTPQPKKPNITPNIGPDKPHRPRPLKKVVDTIENIVPIPWRK